MVDRKVLVHRLSNLYSSLSGRTDELEKIAYACGEIARYLEDHPDFDPYVHRARREEIASNQDAWNIVDEIGRDGKTTSTEIGRRLILQHQRCTGSIPYGYIEPSLVIRLGQSRRHLRD